MPGTPPQGHRIQRHDLSVGTEVDGVASRRLALHADANRVGASGQAGIAPDIDRIDIAGLGLRADGDGRILASTGSVPDRDTVIGRGHAIGSTCHLIGLNRRERCDAANQPDGQKATPHNNRTGRAATRSPHGYNPDGAAKDVPDEVFNWTHKFPYREKYSINLQHQ